MIDKRMRAKLKLRDPYCLHCGVDTDLVVHHRKNRQMGGSKLLDHYSNLLMVCEEYNFRMESSGSVAEEARTKGHKLSSWADFSEPVYDECIGTWFRLEDNGTKTVVDSPEETMF